jgi:aspartyl-tRNA(Asn)/glutamyl-tRNA(Gln) amidotransferase subunit A
VSILIACEAGVSVDAIVTPTTPFPAYRLGNQHLQAYNGVFTRAVTCAGVPALALPCGFTASGLPLGMQLVGRAAEEARLFAFGAAYERATDWHRVRAPLKRAAVGA